MDDYAEDMPRDEQPVLVVEVEGTSVLDSSPPVPPPTAPASLETAGLSSTSQQPSEHIPVTSRDFLAVMDVVRTFAATSTSFAASQTALAERMVHAEVALAQNQAILVTPRFPARPDWRIRTEFGVRDSRLGLFT